MTNLVITEVSPVVLGRKMTGPAAEVLTVGRWGRFDSSTGKITAGNATTGAEAKDGGIISATSIAGLAVTLFMEGIMDLGTALDGMSFGDYVYLSDTDGRLTNSVADATLVKRIGMVVPGWGQTTADKLLWVFPQQSAGDLGLSATIAEIDRAADVSTRLVSVTTATLAITQALHEGRTLVFNKADGIDATLPAATGTGSKYFVVIGTTITSVGAIVKVADATDIMVGLALMAADGGDTVNGWETGATDDTITFNGSTTGGYIGDTIELQDIAANTWLVRVVGKSTGTEATPFSATVS